MRVAGTDGRTHRKLGTSNSHLLLATEERELWKTEEAKAALLGAWVLQEEPREVAEHGASGRRRGSQMWDSGGAANGTRSYSGGGWG